MSEGRAQELAGVSRTQYALFTRSQAVACGYPERTIDHRLRQGIWERWATDVYGPAGLPQTTIRTVLAAVLSAGAGSAAARRTAASFWGLQRPSAVPCVVVPYVQRGPVSLEGICLHRSRTLAADDITAVQDVPATVPDRTLADLCLEEPVRRVRELMARALQRGMTDRASLRRRADLVKGKPGGSVFRRAFGGLVDDVERGRSHPEIDLAERMIRRGLPSPELGYEVREEDGRLIAEVDLAYPWCRLAIEVDGYVWHSTPDRKHYDEVRQNRLVLRGWRVLRFSVQDIRRRPAGSSSRSPPPSPREPPPPHLALRVHELALAIRRAWVVNG